MEWSQVIAVILGNAGVFLPIFFWIRTEANADRRDIASILNEMKQEMKEFHGRLERMDAEHKAAMQNIELRFRLSERNRK